MVKLIALLKRNPNLSREEFNERWLIEHTRLSSLLPSCREYRINLCLPEQPSASLDDNGEPPYDGTAELWWDSLEEMEASFASEKARIAGADADTFCSVRLHLYTREFMVVQNGQPVQPPREVTP